MIIPEEHKATIKALVEVDPEVAQATCDIPHLEPDIWLRAGKLEDDLPYCGCFVGVYDWMMSCKNGNEPDLWGAAPSKISNITSIELLAIYRFGLWCDTKARDHAAVEYARSLLADAPASQ